jgi:hypothetical protein
MSKSAATRDGVTVVIPTYNCADALDKVLPAWGTVLSNLNRPFEIIVVNDGSTDTTTDVLRKRASVPHLRVLTHDAPKGFGECLRTALAETTQPLLLYAGVDYPYTPSDIRPMLERIELRDEVLGKQPDLISGFRAGQPRPALVSWLSGAWQLFWRVFAGLPMTESPPWYGWGEWWYRQRVGWVFGVPLVDVNSAFKLYRVSFLKKVPIQSNSAFVHTELVAKATFLTSIMDEVPLTQKPDPFPALGPISADWWTLLRKPEFVVRDTAPAAQPPGPTATEPPKSEPAPSAPAPSAPAPSAPAPPVPPTPEQSAPAGVNRTQTETPATTPVAPAPAAPTGSAKTESPDTAAKAQPAPTQPAPVTPPAKAETVPGAPAPESTQTTTADTAPQTAQSEPPKMAVAPEAEKASGAQSEPNAGGLSSPGSPVPAT